MSVPYGAGATNARWRRGRRPALRANDGGAVIVVTAADTTNAIVATVGTITVTADTVTVIDTGTVKKRNFHTGLDPVSRINNSAQPTELNAAVTDTVDKVRFAQSSALDTGSSPVWNAVAGTAATDTANAIVSTVASGGDGVGDGAVATVGDGKVSSASPTGMFSLDSRFRGNDEP